MNRHSEQMNALIRRPRKGVRLVSDGQGRARFEPITPAEPADIGDSEPPRVVDGGADGGKGRHQEPEPRVGASSPMNDLIRRESFITEARRIRQRGW